MVPMCVPKLTQIYISLQDAAAAAAHAKDKLMQRQEKLEVREYISILCALHLFHWCHP